MITADSPMHRVAVMIGDLVDALQAEELAKELIQHITAAATPVITSSVLFPTIEMTVTNNIHAE